MNFFEFFQIIFATHFVLGIYLSLLLWRFLPAGLGPLFQQATSPSDAIVGIAASLLSALWYFVWYGSILFALRGRFPIIPPRAFSILLGCVYAGFAMVALLNTDQPVEEFVVQNQVSFFVVALMLLLSVSGAVCLPKLTIHFEIENQRLAQQRDQRLDELHPWISTDAPKSMSESQEP